MRLCHNCSHSGQCHGLQAMKPSHQPNSPHKCRRLKRHSHQKPKRSAHNRHRPAGLTLTQMGCKKMKTPKAAQSRTMKSTSSEHALGAHQHLAAAAPRHWPKGHRSAEKSPFRKKMHTYIHTYIHGTNPGAEQPSKTSLKTSPSKTSGASQCSTSAEQPELLMLQATNHSSRGARGTQP